MSRTVRIPTAAPSDRSPGARILTAAIVALGVALSASAALGGSDYPPGLFENSPVVGPGGQAPANPPGPPAGAEPGPAGPADPYAAEPGPAYPAAPQPPYATDAGPPFAAAPMPPAPIAPTDEYCDGIGMRTFASIEDVRRAHALCDHRRRLAPGY
jgi:hypothetical protein